MRLSADEILKDFPSMYPSNSDFDRVQGLYYGDLPLSICSPVCDSEDRTIQNIEGVDMFIAMCYAPHPVEKYQFHNGSGYRVKGGKLICGELDVHYGGGYPYNIIVFNDHCGSNGVSIAKMDSGVTYTDYTTEGFDFHPWSPRNRRAVIGMDIIEKIFEKVETDDDFGYFARLLVKTARSLVEKSEKNGGV